MRKITLDICAAFMQGASRSIGNSTTDGKTLFLHGNAIAWHGTYQDKPGVFMTLAGWATPTTKERLGGVLDAMGQRVYVSEDLGSLNFYQRKGLQFIGENTRPHKEAIELDAQDVVFVTSREYAQGLAAVYPPAHLGQSQLCKTLTTKWEPRPMSKAQIIAALKRELDASPVYPVMDSAHALQCYDENMNQALEDLRDVCKSIVEEEQED